MKPKLVVDRKSVKVIVGDDVLSMAKNHFYIALQECEKALEDGAVFACLNLETESVTTLRPKSRKTRVVRATKCPGTSGLKIYIPAKEAMWLGISHGSTVTVEPMVLDGEKVLLIKAS